MLNRKKVSLYSGHRPAGSNVLLFVFFALTIAGAGCSKKKTDDPAASSQTDGSQAPGVKSVALPVKRGQIIDESVFQGSVQATERVEIKATSRMKVKKVHVRDNTKVKKGDLLIEVDRSEFEKKVKDLQDRLTTAKIEIKSAELSYAQANKSLRNKERLAAKGIIPEKELIDAKRNQIQSDVSLKGKKLEIEKTQKELKEAQAESASANIRAPISGTVSQLYRMTGSGYDQLNEGQTAAVVANDSQLGFVANISNQDAMRLVKGTQVTITMEAIGQTPVPARVVDIRSAPRSENSGGYGGYGSYGRGNAAQPEMQMVCQFADKLDPKYGTKIRDGVSGSARVVWSAKKETLVIPIGGIRAVGDQPLVLAADTRNGNATPRQVLVGIKTRNEAEITGGLKEGQFVLVEVAE